MSIVQRQSAAGGSEAGWRGNAPQQQPPSQSPVRSSRQSDVTILTNSPLPPMGESPSVVMSSGGARAESGKYLQQKQLATRRRNRPTGNEYEGAADFNSGNKNNSTISSSVNAIDRAPQGQLHSGMAVSSIRPPTITHSSTAGASSTAVSTSSMAASDVKSLPSKIESRRPSQDMLLSTHTTINSDSNGNKKTNTSKGDAAPTALPLGRNHIRVSSADTAAPSPYQQTPLLIDPHADDEKSARGRPTPTSSSLSSAFALEKNPSARPQSVPSVGPQHSPLVSSSSSSSSAAFRSDTEEEKKGSRSQQRSKVSAAPVNEKGIRGRDDSYTPPRGSGQTDTERIGVNGTINPLSENREWGQNGLRQVNSNAATSGIGGVLGGRDGGGGGVFSAASPESIERRGASSTRQGSPFARPNSVNTGSNRRETDAARTASPLVDSTAASYDSSTFNSGASSDTTASSSTHTTETGSARMRSEELSGGSSLSDAAIAYTQRDAEIDKDKRRKKKSARSKHTTSSDVPSIINKNKVKADHRAVSSRHHDRDDQRGMKSSANNLKGWLGSAWGLTKKAMSAVVWGKDEAEEAREQLGGRKGDGTADPHRSALIIVGGAGEETTALDGREGHLVGNPAFRLAGKSAGSMLTPAVITALNYEDAEALRALRAQDDANYEKEKVRHQRARAGDHHRRGSSREMKIDGKKGTRTNSNFEKPESIDMEEEYDESVDDDTPTVSSSDEKVPSDGETRRVGRDRKVRGRSSGRERRGGGDDRRNAKNKLMISAARELALVTAHKMNLFGTNGINNAMNGHPRMTSSLGDFNNPRPPTFAAPPSNTNTSNGIFLFGGEASGDASLRADEEAIFPADVAVPVTFGVSGVVEGPACDPIGAEVEMQLQRLAEAGAAADIGGGIGGLRIGGGGAGGLRGLRGGGAFNDARITPEQRQQLLNLQLLPQFPATAAGNNVLNPAYNLFDANGNSLLLTFAGAGGGQNRSTSASLSGGVAGQLPSAPQFMINAEGQFVVVNDPPAIARGTPQPSPSGGALAPGGGTVAVPLVCHDAYGNTFEVHPDGTVVHISGAGLGAGAGTQSLNTGNLTRGGGPGDFIGGGYSSAAPHSLLDAIRLYKSDPSDYHTNLCLTYLSARGADDYVTAEELAETERNRFLVKLFIEKGALDFNSPDVIGELQACVDEWIGEDPPTDFFTALTDGGLFAGGEGASLVHSRSALPNAPDGDGPSPNDGYIDGDGDKPHIEPSMHEYLRAVFATRHIRITAAQQSRLYHSGFEFGKLMYDFPHVVSEISPHILSRAWWVRCARLVQPLLMILTVGLMCYDHAAFAFIWFEWYEVGDDGRFQFYLSIFEYIAASIVMAISIFIALKLKPISIYSEDGAIVPVEFPSHYLKLFPMLLELQICNTYFRELFCLGHGLCFKKNPHGSQRPNLFLLHDLWALISLSHIIHIGALTVVQLLIQSYYFSWQFTDDGSVSFNRVSRAYTILMTAAWPSLGFAFIIHCLVTSVFYCVTNLGFVRLSSDLERRSVNIFGRMIAIILLYIFICNIFFLIVAIFNFDTCSTVMIVWIVVASVVCLFTIVVFSWTVYYSGNIIRAAKWLLPPLLCQAAFSVYVSSTTKRGSTDECQIFFLVGGSVNVIVGYVGWGALLLVVGTWGLLKAIAVYRRTKRRKAAEQEILERKQREQEEREAQQNTQFSYMIQNEAVATAGPVEEDAGGNATTIEQRPSAFPFFIPIVVSPSSTSHHQTVTAGSSRGLSSQNRQLASATGAGNRVTPDNNINNNTNEAHHLVSIGGAQQQQHSNSLFLEQPSEEVSAYGYGAQQQSSQLLDHHHGGRGGGVHHGQHRRHHGPYGSSDTSGSFAFTLNQTARTAPFH